MFSQKKWSLLHIGKLCSKIGAVVAVLFLAACGDDDENVDLLSDVVSNIRIVEVDALNNEVTLRNFGEGEGDINDYWFCIQRGYASFSETSSDDSDLLLAQGEEITFSIAIADEASDVAIYNTGGSFGSVDALVDFMQFGSSFDGTRGREDVAVEKGIWTAGEFLQEGSPYSYTGDGQGRGISNWDVSSEAAPELGVRLVLVDPLSDLITLKNFGTEDKDVSGYFFCNRKIYVGLGSLTPVSGDLILSGQEEVQFTLDIDDTSSDVALYRNNSGFASTDNILDFLQYGEDVDASGRESVAVSASIWTENEFVPNPGPFEYIGNGDENGASFWQ